MKELSKFFKSIFSSKEGKIILGLIILILVVWLATRHRTPKSKTIKPGELPNSGSGIPNTWSPTPMADQFYNDFKGINWTLTPNGTLFRQYAELPTDDMFTAVYVDWNNRHGNNDFPTLRVWIEDETCVGNFPDSCYYKNMVIQRFNRLNLN